RHRRYSLALLTLAFGWLSPALAFGFLCWLCGALLFFATDHTPMAAQSRSRRLGLLLGTGALFMVTLIWSRTGDYRIEDLLLAASFAIFLYGMLRANPKEWAMFAPIARYGAGASFSLYAIHFPLMAMATGLLIARDRMAPSATAMALVAAMLIGSLVIAWGFSRVTEQNTVKVRQWLRLRLS